MKVKLATETANTWFAAKINVISLFRTTYENNRWNSE